MFEKVGRLKPDEVNDTIRVIVDGIGDIGTITRERVETVITGVNSSITESEVVIGFSFNDEVYEVYARQVKNMMDKWPWKKVGVFREMEK